MTMIHGDSLLVLPTLDAESVDAIVCDPPYGLSFMGKEWDHGVPGPAFWREALRVAKPGAHLLAFGGTRTWHRLACAIEDAGWEIRDCLSWNFGSGFPKSHNIDKTGVGCACDDNLPGMQPRVLTAPIAHQAIQAPDVLAEVQWDGTGPRVGEARVQGNGGETVGHVTARPRESGMEGGSNVEASEGELYGSAVRPRPGVGAPDGAEGRLHHGASASDGAARGPLADAHGGCASPESRPLGQRADESGAVADERLAQGGGVWPTCQRCGKPRITRGLGTALKPAYEPIILARKPLIGTVAANVAQYGTGAVNVDACRIGTDGGTTKGTFPRGKSNGTYGDGINGACEIVQLNAGRWPANVLLDEDAAAMLDAQTQGVRATKPHPIVSRVEQYAGYGSITRKNGETVNYDEGDARGASRFFYTSKASRREREAGLEGMPTKRAAMLNAMGDNPPENIDPVSERFTTSPSANHHPTVKPIAVMRWLCRLVTPPNGLILDPFTGSGTTGCAAALEGFRFIGIEREAEYVEIATRRIAHWESTRGFL